MKGWAGIGRLGGIGDNLVAASVLRPLKRMGYMTEVITSPMASTVYLNNPYLDKLSIKGDGDLPGGDDWQKWFVSRGREYEVFAHLSHSMEVRHALFPNDTAFWTRPEYRRKICGGSYIETVHDIVGAPYDFGPLFFSTEEEKEKALKTKAEVMGGRYLVWALSGSRIDKIYPYTAAAICRIIKELDIPVVMMGHGDMQKDMAKVVQEEVMRSNSSTKGLHLALSTSAPGEDYHWSIRRSLSQLIQAEVVVTVDTGLAWAAAFEPMPKVVMVSHASVDNITKHWVNTETLHADPNRIPCWPCHRLHNDMSTCTPAKDNANSAACITDISVETIIENVSNALSVADTNVLQFPKASHA